VGLALLDSSTVIGYLDRSDRLHGGSVVEVERALGARAGLALSAITWSELLHGALIGHQREDGLLEFAADFDVEILPADVGVASRAAELQASYAQQGRPGEPRRLKTPDALILATGDLEPEVEMIICGDEKWRRISGVRPEIRLVGERVP
jgi:predicted nucleic acid-binding protein